MFAISTKGIGMMDIGTTNSAGKTKSKDDKSENVFASIMDLASAPKDSQKNVVQDGKTTDFTKDKISDTDHSNTTKYVKNQDSDTKAVASENHNSEKTISDASNDNADVENDEQITDKLEKIIETLTGYIMDSLGIDEEKLSSILQDMDIQAVDLLDSDKLKAFVLYASDSKEVDMLINEDLSQLVNETMEALQNIIDEFDMESDFPKLIEEFKAVIQDKEINLSETAKMQNPDREKVMQNEPNADKIVDNEVGYTQTDTAEEASNKNFKENGHEDSKENRLSDNLNHAIDIAFGSADGIEEASFVNEINEADIVKQIIDDIKANVTRDTRSLEIKLNPENLGKISITVTEKEGVMQARIIADNEAARNAIETSLSLLKEAFDNQELKVDAVEVMIADYESFNQEQTEGENQDSEGQMKGQASGINLDDLDEEDSISEEQRLEVEIMRANGNRLSYSI